MLVIAKEAPSAAPARPSPPTPTSDAPVAQGGAGSNGRGPDVGIASDGAGGGPLARPVAPSCGATPPPRRTGNNLVVDSPAHPQEQASYLRLRTHVAGTLSSGAERKWIGGEVPSFVPLVAGVPSHRATEELFLLDAGSEGFFAFYRDPYGSGGSCTLGAPANCAFSAALYACDGHEVFRFALDPVLSRKDHLEIQDIRYDRGVVYFNEACQSYAKEAGGKCSSLVAFDPRAQRVLWRTGPLVSNGRFALTEGYVVSGYGFTAESDFVRLVRRSDGAVVDTKAVATAPSGIVVDGDRVAVTVYPGTAQVHFRLVGGDGPAAHLVREK